MNKIDKYLNELYINEDFLLLKEELDKVLPKPDKGMFKKISNMLDQSNIQGSLAKLVKMVPNSVSPSLIQKAEGKLESNAPQYVAMKDKATRVIKNSTNVSPKMAEASGSALAVLSLFAKKSEKNKKPEQILNDNLKAVISKARSFGEEYEDDEDENKSKLRPSDISDMAVAFTIITLSVAIAWGVLSGGYAVVAAVLAGVASISWMGLWVGLLVLVGVYGIAFILGKVLGGKLK